MRATYTGTNISITREYADAVSAPRSILSTLLPLSLERLFRILCCSYNVNPTNCSRKREKFTHDSFNLTSRLGHSCMN